MCLQVYKAYRFRVAILDGYGLLTRKELEENNKRELILVLKLIYIPKTKAYSYIEAGVYID